MDVIHTMYSRRLFYINGGDGGTGWHRNWAHPVFGTAHPAAARNSENTYWVIYKLPIINQIFIIYKLSFETLNSYFEITSCS